VTAPNRTYLVRRRQIGQHLVVVLDGSRWNPARQIVGASQYQNSVGMQIDHIGLHPLK